MTHSNRMFPYLIGAAAVAALLIAFGAPLAFAILLACPLMMVVMMRGMAGTHSREDHTGHGCEHDPTRTAESPTSHRQRPSPASTPAAIPPTAPLPATAEPGMTATVVDDPS